MKHLIRYAWLRLLGYRRLKDPYIRRGTCHCDVKGIAWVRQNRRGVHILYEEVEQVGLTFEMEEDSDE